MNWPAEDPEIAQHLGPHVAVDVALMTVVPEPKGSDTLAVVAHRRSADAHGPGDWALIGRMVRERDTLADTVQAALQTKCGIPGLKPEQLFVADAPDRDSRGWVMSVAHIATEPWTRLRAHLENRDDLALIRVVHSPDINYYLPDDQRALPYEQDTIVREAIASLRQRYADHPDPGFLLPEEFTVHDLRRVHEAVLGASLDKDVFRRHMKPFLEATHRMSEGSVGRPARLFRRREGHNAAAAAR